MASNTWNQKVTLIYGAPADVEELNIRDRHIQSVGIYKGGYLSVVDSSHCALSPLICIITDGTYQVRIHMQDTATLAVSPSSAYIILRWQHYTEQSNDYMEVLAVATPQTNDLVVGKCIFSGGSLVGFNYVDPSFSRSIPKDPYFYFLVESTEQDELRVLIRGGIFQTKTEKILIPDQKSSTLAAPSVGSKVYLIYIDSSTGSVEIDSSGTAGSPPEIPNYAGRFVLAEVTVNAGDTRIQQNQIKDVRTFLTNTGPLVDAQTIEFNTNRELKLKSIPNGMVNYSNIGSIFGEWTDRDSLNNVFAKDNVYKVTSDGFVVAYARCGEDKYIEIYSDNQNPPVTKRLKYQPESEGSGWAGFTLPIRNNNYWKIVTNTTYTSNIYIFWIPIGSGQCIKQ